MQTFGNLAFLDLRDRYVHELEADLDPEALQMRLAAMAHALQIAMSVAIPSVPHAYALEVLMRVVAHDIAGDPSSKQYIREKLQVGYDRLMSALR